MKWRNKFSDQGNGLVPHSSLSHSFLGGQISEEVGGMAVPGGQILDRCSRYYSN